MKTSIPSCFSAVFHSTKTDGEAVVQIFPQALWAPKCLFNLPAAASFSFWSKDSYVSRNSMKDFWGHLSQAHAEGFDGA